MSLSINVAFFLAVLIVLRMRGHTLAGGRADDLLMVFVVLLFVVLVAPTDFGEWTRDSVGGLVSGLVGAVVDLVTP
ncbi:hypothetical protein RB200_36590 [Streptomyces sp. PmtG]